MEKFDFRVMATLAEEDPAEFELQRAALIEQAISSAAPARQPALRKLQAQLDAQRLEDPEGHLSALFSRMADSFENVGDQFTVIHHTISGPPTVIRA